MKFLSKQCCARYAHCVLPVRISEVHDWCIKSWNGIYTLLCVLSRIIPIVTEIIIVNPFQYTTTPKAATPSANAPAAPVGLAAAPFFDLVFAAPDVDALDPLDVPPDVVEVDIVFCTPLL